MQAAGFANNFTSGEISEDAWDRPEIQPVAHGCEEAINYVIRIAGPLAKRRGFWDIGAVADETKLARLVPFRRSINDALMLEFGDLTVTVWNNDGSPVMDGMDQVTFVSPYAEADLANLRWKQVADVIYFRTADGQKPQTLTRSSNTSWSFAAETFPNGPWLPENIGATTITVTGTDESDANTDGGAGSILAGQSVALVASTGVFDAGQIGGYFRLRQGDGNPPVKSWTSAYAAPLGEYCLSNGRVYKCTTAGTHAAAKAFTPPVQESGDQSDGSNIWTYRHDGAGIAQLTAVANATHATATVTATLPFKSGTATTKWAEGAWSDYRGWPRAWPAVREERLAEGANAQNLDFVDLTETAGFYPTSENFHPGLGTGQVVDTDAIRRRIGDDGGELIALQAATYLMAFTASGEYLVAGSVLDEPLSPSSVTIKPLSSFGSISALPVRAFKGLIWIARGAQTVREIIVDPAQNATGDDLTVLARHIADRSFAELAFAPQPDNALWARLADGGLAVMTYHQEQQVRGWTRQALGGGFICESLAVLPGPGGFETLWMVVSRSKNDITQRRIWMLSQKADALTGMDGAAFYSGDPAPGVTGLRWLAGETCRVLADGVESNVIVADDGSVTLPNGATAAVIQAGAPFAASFRSLKLPRTINEKQRVTGVTVKLLTALAQIGVDGGRLETFSTRQVGDIPGASAKTAIKNVNIAADTSRDPRIVIVDDTAYAGEIYSFKPVTA